MKGSILIVDDDRNFRFAMRKALQRLGYAVEESDSAEAALPLIENARTAPDVALLDLHMDGMGGLELIRRCQQSRPRFVVLTGHGTIAAAVEAMKLGAFSFLEKPVDAEALGPLLEQAMAELKTPGKCGESLPDMIGASDEMVALRRFIARVAPTEETVLIYGETGVGKEVVARHIHQSSMRRAGPFVPFNAAAISPRLLESELFGHARGAFSGAVGEHAGLFREAHGGTLFMDEVGELSLPLQAALLRAVETRLIRAVGAKRDVPVDVRIVAATNRDLWGAVQAGTFREDLYYRLHVVPVTVAPLRSRSRDVVQLAALLLQSSGGEHTLTEEAQHVLRNYRWPGNVRELLNVLRRATLFAEGPELDAYLLRRMIAASLFAHAASDQQDSRKESVNSSEIPRNLAEAERAHIEAVLAQFDGNRTHAARALGINLRTLQRKMVLYNSGFSAGDDTAPAGPGEPPDPKARA